MPVAALDALRIACGRSAQNFLSSAVWTIRDSRSHRAETVLPRLARWCAIAIVLLVVSAAHARDLGLITTGGDILHLRDLPPETAAAVGFHSLGYRYNVLGIYWLDFWR
jgi:hypothetical protein